MLTRLFYFAGGYGRVEPVYVAGRAVQPRLPGQPPHAHLTPHHQQGLHRDNIGSDAAETELRYGFIA